VIGLLWRELGIVPLHLGTLFGAAQIRLTSAGVIHLLFPELAPCCEESSHLTDKVLAIKINRVECDLPFNLSVGRKVLRKIPSLNCSQRVEAIYFGLSRYCAAP
jgi:hypothetical protein